MPKYFEFGTILTLVEGEVVSWRSMGFVLTGISHPMLILDQETLEFLKVNAAATNHYGYEAE